MRSLQPSRKNAAPMIHVLLDARARQGPAWVVRTSLVTTTIHVRKTVVFLKSDVKTHRCLTAAFPNARAKSVDSMDAEGSVANARTLNPASILVCASVNASQTAQVKIVGLTDVAGSAARAQSVRSAAQMVYAEKVVSPIAQARNAGLTDVGASVETARADGHVTTRTSASKTVVSRTAQEKSAARTDVVASVAVVPRENLAASAHAKGDAPPTAVERNAARTDVVAFAGQDALEAKSAVIWEPVLM